MSSLSGISRDKVEREFVAAGSGDLFVLCDRTRGALTSIRKLKLKKKNFLKIQPHTHQISIILGLCITFADYFSNVVFTSVVPMIMMNLK